MTNTTPAAIEADALLPVVTWLDNGCDPKQAAEELRLLVQRAAAPKEAAAPAAVAEPVAWLHDDPQRYDVIHAEVKDLLVKSRDAAGHLHRPLDKSAHYTIPLYAAPAPAAQGDALDAARLDYIIESRAIVVSDPSSALGYWLEFISPGADRWVQIGEYPTPRAAIDAALAAKEGDQHG